jgi:sulfiredoxin
MPSPDFPCSEVEAVLAMATWMPPVAKRKERMTSRHAWTISASILDKGLQTPILVRADGACFVLVEGLHRLGAAKALGEETIVGFLVEARKHQRTM